MSLVSLLRKKCRKTLFTTPSHSGKFYIMHKFYQWYKADISEIDALEPEDALRQAEQNASRIYGTKMTKFLANGSTSGVIAATLACCSRGDKLLVWNKSHPCHKNAGKLAGAEIIEYNMNYDEQWGVYTGIKLEQVSELISKYFPKAIIITSPTYEGFVSDIRNIAQLCKEHGVYLIVDEAHGALYPFSDRLPQTAIPYADFTIQSLHKTAGGINPTALLHLNCDVNIEAALKMISTTSPSYPMFATIEANINYLNSKKGRQKIDDLIDNIYEMKSKLPNIEFGGDDVTKILVKNTCCTGYELSSLLYNRYDIEDERANEKSVLFLTGIGTTKEKLKKLFFCLSKAENNINS